MSVISILIEENPEQIVAGIPRTITLSSNIPSTIFYTLDGSIPSDSSQAYVFPIKMPTDKGSVELKIFATNGLDYSSIITKVYSTSIVNNSRLPHAGIANFSHSKSGYPFGTNAGSGITYLPPSENSQIVNNPSLPVYPAGFDAQGEPAGGTNLPLMEYLLIPPLTDKENRLLPGVLPGNKKVIGRRYPTEYDVEESDRASKLFDPKAMVIFQNSETEDKSVPPMINRSDFSAENLEIINNGDKLRATALETPSTTGAFLKSYYNPRTEMMTNYYRDASTNKWIISPYPYNPKAELQPGVPLMVFPKGPRIVGKVFEWRPWQHRVLT